MKPRTRSALHIGFHLCAISMVISGFMMSIPYLTTDRFTSFHAAATGFDWRAVPDGLQLLILILIRVAGGMGLTITLVVLLLGLLQVRAPRRSYRWAMVLANSGMWLTLFLVTSYVFRETGAPTPWLPSLIQLGVAGLAAVLLGFLQLGR